MSKSAVNRTRPAQVTTYEHSHIYCIALAKYLQQEQFDDDENAGEKCGQLEHNTAHNHQHKHWYYTYHYMNHSAAAAAATKTTTTISFCLTSLLLQVKPISQL